MASDWQVSPSNTTFRPGRCCLLASSRTYPQQGSRCCSCAARTVKPLLHCMAHVRPGMTGTVCTCTQQGPYQVLLLGCAQVVFLYRRIRQYLHHDAIRLQTVCTCSQHRRQHKVNLCMWRTLRKHLHVQLQAGAILASIKAIAELAMICMTYGSARHVIWRVFLLYLKHTGNSTLFAHNVMLNRKSANACL